MWESASWMVVIALIGAYIAHQQYKLARQRFDLELFDRRMKLYEDVVAFLRGAVVHPGLPDGEILTIVEARGRSRFLFGPDVERRLEDIQSRAGVSSGRYATLKKSGFGGSSLDSESDVTPYFYDDKLWFYGQFESISDVFAPYLSFGGERVRPRFMDWRPPSFRVLTEQLKRGLFR